jgi:nucleoside-diphosphate-sugar epimerase
MSNAPSGAGPDPAAQAGPTAAATRRHVAVAGASGFIGKALARRWPIDSPASLRLFIHRSRPGWIDRLGPDAVEVNFEDVTSLSQGLAGVDVVMNLLRPDGSGWFTAATRTLIEAASRAGASRYIHVSSIDVYGSAPALALDEEAPVRPQTAYEREHAASEHVALNAAGQLDVGVIRLGAVFGEGGRNVIALADEMRRASTFVLAVRRALNGRRRMHLVSVETAIDALHFLANVDHPLGATVFLLTDDEAPENNFGWVQDALAEVFVRPRMDMIPALPSGLMRMLLRFRGRSDCDPMRRFASRRLAALGFKRTVEFTEQLRTYIKTLPMQQRSD